MAVENDVPAVGGDESSLQALVQAFAMIIVSEIGDKTFLIAAILAMRHPRAVVFAGAFGSLVVMSALSASLGHLLPTLIPKRWTQVLAAVLFLVFGYKMLQEAREMKAGNDKIREEMKEAEEIWLLSASGGAARLPGGDTRLRRASGPAGDVFSCCSLLDLPFSSEVPPSALPSLSIVFSAFVSCNDH